jgi:hypothetical protein
LEGEIKGLRKWRVGGEIWRGLKNEGSFGGPAGVVFFHQTSKIWSRDTYEAPTRVAPIVQKYGGAVALHRGCLAAWLTLAWLEFGARLAQACLIQCNPLVFGRVNKDSLGWCTRVW